VFGSGGCGLLDEIRRAAGAIDHVIDEVVLF
jgi:hypothetical protein